MKLYNSLTKSVEPFKPMKGKKVNLFVCGPTVYDYSHLGHAKTYIQLDVLARVLRHAGYEVFYLQNITDLDDKIIIRAQEKGVGWEDLRSQYEGEYIKDMKSLGNTSVTKYARATDHIDDIIRQVQTLIEKDHAYIIEDGIYFEVATFPDYGKLSGRQEVKENDAQTRIDHSEEKRGWNDFCVWKFSKPGEPTWNAPFGSGRPGWHIEDTAIAEHFFGPQYDIHGGAIDLIFPHHEAEITQMEAASGKVPFVKYWVHTGFLNIDDTKMSKSLGNFYTIREVLEKGYEPMAIRLLMLQSHYRSTINFSWEQLDAAQARLLRFRNFAARRHQIKPPNKSTEKLFTATPILLEFEIMPLLEEDLNTPKALAAVEEFIDATETDDLVGEYAVFDNFIKVMDDVFGLNLIGEPDITPEQKKLIHERETARLTKDWAKSDQLRDELTEQGLEINDTPQGPIWRRVGQGPSTSSGNIGVGE